MLGTGAGLGQPDCAAAAIAVAVSGAVPVCNNCFTHLPKSNQYYCKNTMVLQDHTIKKYKLEYLLYISAGVVA